MTMIKTLFMQELVRWEINMGHAWFQQDGDTAHTARAFMAADWASFLERGDLRAHLFMWDFFLWGHLKANVYIEKPLNTLWKNWTLQLETKLL